MRLHAPTPEHYQSLCSWITDARDCQRWAGPHLPFPFFAHELPNLLQQNAYASHCYSMLDKGDHFLGFGQLVYKQESTAHLARLIIAPSARGLGLAKQLCLLLMEKAQQERAIQRYTLNVYRDHPIAIKTYLKLGFVSLNEFYNDDAEVMQMEISVRHAKESNR